MLTAVLFTIAVPIVAIITSLALRGRHAGPAADSRGIALQTIIVIVVLLAIAGAVAAVLLTRAGEEQGRLEEIETNPNYFLETETECDIAQGDWNHDGHSAGSASEEHEGHPNHNATTDHCH